MLTRLLTFIFLISAVQLNAQTPSYYLVGEETLLGVDVYSIVQDEMANIWLGTSDGLKRYDGYQFYAYDSPRMTSGSLFGLTFDNNGTLYCHSINGRIYKVVNDSIELHYALPDSLVTDYMYMCFDDRNELIISSGSYYRLDENKRLELLLESSTADIHLLEKREDGSVLLVDSEEKELKYYKDGKLNTLAHFSNDFQEERHFHPMCIDQTVIGTIGNNSFYKVKKDSVIDLNLENLHPANGNLNIFHLGDSKFWVASSTNGVQAFDLNGKAIFGSQVLFPEYRISQVIKDREGNVWLTTLGKGILVIQNEDVKDVYVNERGSRLNFRSLGMDERGFIYVGSQEGKLYKIKQDLSSVVPVAIGNESDKIKRITYLPETEQIYAGRNLVQTNGEGVKLTLFTSDLGVVDIKGNGWLIAHQKGAVFLDGTNDGNLNPVLEDFPFRWARNKLSATMNLGRTYSVYYDAKSEKIWAATSLGVKLVSKKGIQELKLNGSAIQASRIVGDEDEVWVATNDGVLRFQDEKLIRQFTIKDGLKENRLTDLKRRGGYIYIASSSGLQRINRESGKIQSISKSKGLYSNRIIDFEVDHQHVWIITPLGLQRFNKAMFNEEVGRTAPYFIQVLANGTELQKDHTSLKYTENRLLFKFASAGFMHRGELNYEYQLKGISDEWVSLNFDENKVEFPSLPPGQYEFVLRTKNVENKYSKAISYSFEIQHPFWERWWFYLLCSFLVLGIFLLIYRMRMRIVKRRLILERQLKVSEIKAIKSQMNPHFVFNALNSVQDLMMMEDVRSSNIYLSHFASLMRKTLEVSSEQYITLEEEIEMLELYLQLEKLRFGDDFEYSITTELNNGISDYKVPTMLIQPYVENAIKHGLLHKKGDKKLDISFEDVDGGLYCEIRDNGIGRVKSKEINDRRPFQHKSFSTSANESRIDLINQTLSQKVAFDIEDLERNGDSVGTVVKFFFS